MPPYSEYSQSGLRAAGSAVVKPDRIRHATQRCCAGESPPVWGEPSRLASALTCGAHLNPLEGYSRGTLEALAGHSGTFLRIGRRRSRRAADRSSRRWGWRRRYAGAVQALAPPCLRRRRRARLGGSPVEYRGEYRCEY